MKGYIYITSNGTDPGLLDNLNDPIFKKTPTLGACMPNIRRVVTKGDYIFVVSGKTPSVQQYVVGGICVEEKISALVAYKRYPEYRLAEDSRGKLQGNIIVNAKGHQHKLDQHDPDTFERRIENYIVGSKSVALRNEREIALSRAQTLDKLSSILQRPKGNRVIDVMSRWAKLNETQVNEMLDWLNRIKAVTG
jgi:hypothetical protein